MIVVPKDHARRRVDYLENVKMNHGFLFDPTTYKRKGRWVRWIIQAANKKKEISRRKSDRNGTYCIGQVRNPRYAAQAPIT